MEENSLFLETDGPAQPEMKSHSSQDKWIKWANYSLALFFGVLTFYYVAIACWGIIVISISTITQPHIDCPDVRPFCLFSICITLFMAFVAGLFTYVFFRLCVSWININRVIFLLYFSTIAILVFSSVYFGHADCSDQSYDLGAFTYFAILNSIIQTYVWGIIFVMEIFISCYIWLQKKIANIN